MEALISRAFGDAGAMNLRSLCPLRQKIIHNALNCR